MDLFIENAGEDFIFVVERHRFFLFTASTALIH